MELNIVKRPLDNRPLISNAWLSGFIDADGHFSVRTTTISRYPKIECKFELTQRQIDHNGRSYLAILTSIGEFLFCTVKSIRVSKTHPEYRVRTTNLKGNLTLVNYLENNPLFSSKYLDYKDWLKVLNVFKEGEHKDKSGIEKITSIKLGMNARRAVFIWDHLNKFYNLDK